ncbi:hypothetical protein [Calothrix sp. NIES-3974]|uniref:hypothetical protein n=1 Tax=Calothrix sp. NIES-3974 TaxID=2005462 RepID=UPI000BBC4545|nr:hypothetical protein [Calothrix sp. NIES-3974]
MENTFLNYLALLALVLLVVTTLSIGYLTLSGWRDRRLLEEEKRNLRLRTTPKRK